ncbi:MAG: hypothetical protein NTW21_27280 [Verrucomicrobia bacterium]|nr:hypothetical protein [Verrucomicrobiota bacterium]
MITYPKSKGLAIRSLRLPRIFLAMTCALPAVTKADDFPPPGFTEMRSELSPGGNFKIVRFNRDPNDYEQGSQLWLQSLKPEFKTQLLFSHLSSVALVISPDENFIAINYHRGSGVGLLHVFSRDKDGWFHEIKKDFLNVTEKLMRTQLKLKQEIDLDHLYCMADSWLRDGLLLGHLDGHKSGAYHVSGWYFIYDVKNDRFLWDLSKINQGTFGLIKPQIENK